MTEVDKKVNLSKFSDTSEVTGSGTVIVLFINQFVVCASRFILPVQVPNLCRDTSFLVVPVYVGGKRQGL